MKPYYSLQLKYLGDPLHWSSISTKTADTSLRHDSVLGKIRIRLISA